MRGPIQRFRMHGDSVVKRRLQISEAKRLGATCSPRELALELAGLPAGGGLS